MAGEIQALFNTYQQKHMTLNRNAIVDLMLNDGVITYDVAQKIKSGVSLFLIDNPAAAQKNETMTEIMGGHFTKSKPETNFNRQIETTHQGSAQGDCWLLSDINALNFTSWGKKAIHDAIIPDTNGSGGVTIKFKGSPLKQKEIHITAQELDKARKSGNYSSGDDDMLAFELATEKTFRQMVQQGIATRTNNDKEIINKGGKYRSYIWGGVRTKEFRQYPISELLGIKVKVTDFIAIREQKTAEKDTNKILNWLAQNKNNVSATCGFAIPSGEYGNKHNKNFIHNGHSYAIKSLNSGKDVVLSDPYHPENEIKIPWNVFTKYVKRINFSFKDEKIAQNFQNVLPKNYEQIVNDSKKATEKPDAKTTRQKVDNFLAEWKKDKAEQNKKIQERNKERISRNIKYALQVLQKARETDSTDDMHNPAKIFNKDTIIAVLDKYPDIVVWLDKKTYGWGNGDKKRFLIRPIINALAQKAQEKKINSKNIEEFKSKCNKELDATFYTDEKVLQREVMQLLKLIKAKS